jgi:DedD protein
MAEHKRRARWRLLGAFILVGAVAAAAPILLEDQARPLSQDLLIEMPTRVVAPAPQPVKAQPEAPQPAKAELQKPQAPQPPPEPIKTEAPKQESPAVKTPKGFMVQVGAYSSKEAATRVKARLEAGGHRVAIQSIKTESGAERHRVRIGPFDTREQATEVKERAKLQGYDAAVVSAS